MTELIFTLKTLLAAAAIVVIMQVKIGGSSIEERTSNFLEKSEVSLYVQSVAAGGALALTNFAKQVKIGIQDSISSYQQGASEQRASK